MKTRSGIIAGFYQEAEEDERLQRSLHGQLEYRTTMAYIDRYSESTTRILEVGAGTGRYSIALAKAGNEVRAVELSDENLRILRVNSRGLENLQAFQGDAVDLSRFADESFDLTLVLGPMYHLFDAAEVNMAIDEAIRVTKPNGVIFFAFLSVYAIMYANYVTGNWEQGLEENFTEDYRVRHFPKQIFTGYDVTEFEALFAGKPVDWITTVSTDGMLEAIEDRPDFSIPEEDFDAFAEWHLAFAEKRELLGSSSHLLYICRRR